MGCGCRKNKSSNKTKSLSKQTSKAKSGVKPVKKAVGHTK